MWKRLFAVAAASLTFIGSGCRMCDNYCDRREWERERECRQVRDRCNPCSNAPPSSNYDDCSCR